MRWREKREGRVIKLFIYIYIYIYKEVITQFLGCGGMRKGRDRQIAEEIPRQKEKGSRMGKNNGKR